MPKVKQEPRFVYVRLLIPHDQWEYGDKIRSSLVLFKTLEIAAANCGLLRVCYIIHSHTNWSAIFGARSYSPDTNPKL